MDRVSDRGAAKQPTLVEWPTLGLAVLIYGGFALLTLNYHSLPWWVVLPLGGYLVAWHGSLQHEVVHNHPTASPGVNEALVFPSLWLWMPYRIYRDSHLKHHRNEYLTDPFEDPESYYVTPAVWSAAGPLGRAFLVVYNTFAGRLLLGPAYCVLRLCIDEARRLIRGDGRNLLPWLLHLLGIIPVLYWVIAVCRIPLLEYVLFFAYPGLSLTLLRSFLEHQARDGVGERTVIVDAEWPIGLLFLNNNLHVLHHERPGLAWYRLPKVYGEQRERLLAENGGYHYRGYWEIALRYLFWPKEWPVHQSAHAVKNTASGDAPLPAQ